MKKYSKVCKVSTKKNSKVCKSMQSCAELIKSMQKNVKQNKGMQNYTKVKNITIQRHRYRWEYLIKLLPKLESS